MWCLLKRIQDTFNKGALGSVQIIIIVVVVGAIFALTIVLIVNAVGGVSSELATIKDGGTLVPLN